MAGATESLKGLLRRNRGGCEADTGILEVKSQPDVRFGASPSWLFARSNGIGDLPSVKATTPKPFAGIRKRIVLVPHAFGGLVKAFGPMPVQSPVDTLT